MLNHGIIDPLPAAGTTRNTDLHVRRLGTGTYTCALSLLTYDFALTLNSIREHLGIYE